MDNKINHLLQDAELAVTNERYETALELLEQVLGLAPENLQALSRAGAISVALEKFDKAYAYFEKALQIDPNDGSNHFNMGNACFFRGEHARAFAYFTEADRIGCPDDVQMQLWYQMMILCSIRQDFNAALIYMQRVEDQDQSGQISLTPEFIKEKLKLHTMMQDLDGALKYAAQMAAVAPSDYNNYAVLCTLQMAREQYGAAELTLDRAERYAVMSQADEVALAGQRAALFATVADKDPDNAEEYYAMAIETLEPILDREDLEVQMCRDVIVTLCDVYHKAGMYEQCIDRVEMLLHTVGDDLPTAEEAAAFEDLEDRVYEIDERILNAQLHEARIAMARGTVAQVSVEKEAPAAAEDDSPELLDAATREKLLFLLLSSQLALDRFTDAHETALQLKDSENPYYDYYGRYVETMTSRYLGLDREALARKYAETIAFFRSKIVQNHTDALAAIFRARLYAEQGKYEKARQIARMLVEEDQRAICAYIDELRNRH